MHAVPAPERLIEARFDAAVKRFWHAPDLQIAVMQMRERDRSGLFCGMAEIATQVADAHRHLRQPAETTVA